MIKVYLKYFTYVMLDVNQMLVLISEFKKHPSAVLFGNIKVVHKEL